MPLSAVEGRNVSTRKGSRKIADSFFEMVLLRIAWIFGAVSTNKYDALVREREFGPQVPAPCTERLEGLERALVEDRLAVVLFLAAAIILLYTFQNAPMG